MSRQDLLSNPFSKSKNKTKEMSILKLMQSQRQQGTSPIRQHQHMQHKNTESYFCLTNCDSTALRFSNENEHLVFNDHKTDPSLNTMRRRNRFESRTQQSCEPGLANQDRTRSFQVRFSAQRTTRMKALVFVNLFQSSQIIPTIYFNNYFKSYFIFYLYAFA